MKKLVFGLLVIAVFGYGLYIYHVWFGDPFTKNAAEQKLISYAKQTYPKKEMKIMNGVYNAKTSEYVFQANIQSHRYPMCTKGFLHPKVTCDGIEEAYTESVAKHVNEVASKAIEADLKKAVPQYSIDFLSKAVIQSNDAEELGS
ncbi:hypothetical protein AB1L06_16095 [Bacillus mojavensis]|nr:hypothetical protein [Bacillus mojavensis]MEC1753248.1 hypothetical protein [Bacillus mojavensis]